jgi:hypothetical protein
MFSTRRIVALEDMSLQVPTVLKKRKSDDEISGRDNKKTAIQLRGHTHGLDEIHAKEHNHAQALDRESGDGHGQDVSSSEDFDRTQLLAQAREVIRKSREKRDHWQQKPIKKRRKPWCCSCGEETGMVQDDEEGGGGVCPECGHSRCPECLLCSQLKFHGA